MNAKKRTHLSSAKGHTTPPLLPPTAATSAPASLACIIVETRGFLYPYQQPYVQPFLL
jgi:hypothetical protein